MKKRDIIKGAKITGARGGEKAAANMTPEQRSERARKAAAAMWAKRAEEKQK
jgi:hypothetical protein